MLVPARRRGPRNLGPVAPSSNLGAVLPLSPDGRAALRAMPDGDGRFLLNLVEEIARLPAGQPLGPAALADIVQRRAPLYDKAQEQATTT